MKRCGGSEKDAGSVHAVVQYMEQVNVRRCGGGEKASLNASDTASKLQCMEQVNVEKMRWEWEGCRFCSGCGALQGAGKC